MDLHVEAVDKVIKHAISVIEDSKYQIFEICQNVRFEREALEQELLKTMDDLTYTIDLVDQLEMKFRLARTRLSEVSKAFHRFKEEDIRTAYEQATSLQLDVMIQREKESHLKVRRDELHKRIRAVEKSIERAEALGSRMNVVLEYLSGDLNQVTRILESAKNRQLLGLKIILAQEEERKRIAREIHDGVAQSLANMVLRSEITERLMAKQQFPAAQMEISDLKGQVRDSLEEIRKIIFNLRPMALDDLGLIPSLRKYVQDFEEKTRIRTKFEFFGKEIRLPSAMEVAIYRLVQEAFSNALKHAEASYLTLEVVYQKHMIKIVIQDNGIGFNPDLLQSMHAKDRSSHFGLIGMRERIELLEGRFDIQSAPQEGTRNTILIPIKMQKGEG